MDDLDGNSRTGRGGGSRDGARGAVLLTGGAGYIGSHTAVQVAASGREVVILDDLSNSSYEAVRRVRELCGTDVAFHRVDLCDAPAVEEVFEAHDFEAVVHFAGLKAVGESVCQPLRYWRTNLTATFNLVDAMRRHHVRRLVFSSSATVYGDPERVPLTEDCRLAPTNPYGHTKLAIEQILDDVARSEPGWHIVLLRYFNPVGAHPSGRIGEDPRGIPNNLVPYLMQVAVGRLPEVTIFGDDWPTPDGTGVRDFVHVMDLADAHVAALDALDCLPGCRPVNVGTGRGYSVLELLEATRRTTGRPVPARVGPRRTGDVATSYADPSLAHELLGWRARRDLDAMVADSWRWQSSNPAGYA